MEYQGQQQHGHAADRVDEYGNAVAGHGVTGGMGAKSAALAFTGTDGQLRPGREERKARGILHRSGSSSSSSSSSEEDDGMGGRRKKGIKEKIKEKLPGGQEQHTATETGGTYGQQGHGGMTGTGGHGVDTGEKKGLMDKIKEKLPGQH